MILSKFRGLAAACTVLVLGLSAHNSFADAGHKDASKIGKPGKANEVTRTINVKMFDSYYEPKSLSIKEGETVRFVVHNAGELVHEFNIATHEMHMAHAPEMMKMMESGVLEADRINRDAGKAMSGSMGNSSMGKGAMGHGSMMSGMHDDPNSVLLEPGKSGEIIWTFPKHAKLEFACNVPGHYDAGMKGLIKLSH